MTNTIVLLRGLVRGQHHWGTFLDQVKAQFPEQKVIAIDLAGNGERYKEQSPDNIKDAVKDIREQLQANNLQPPPEHPPPIVLASIHLHPAWRHTKRAS